MFMPLRVSSYSTFLFCVVRFSKPNEIQGFKKPFSAGLRTYRHINVKFQTQINKKIHKNPKNPNFYLTFLINHALKFDFTKKT
ncbi:MAG: hypothetical protein EAZ97_10285 [Bacteroidetes bacterium]|nr:MAG: hypothetical protein EAZ97_10285 [Bacteroidota bacterium]